MSVLDKVRKWIDGETAEGVLEAAARDAQVKPRSKAEEFIVKIARAVEEVMQRELVPLPQGTVIIPTEYTVFFSEEDDKDWQGAKRRGLEQGLYHILAERAREIAGKRKLETETFLVKFKVDGTLAVGEVRVQHGWEDPAQPKTQVFSRGSLPVPPAPPAPAGSEPAAGPQAGRSASATDPNLKIPQSDIPPAPPVSDANGAQNPVRFPPPSAYGNEVPQQPPAEDMTQVGRRNRELYKLEIWKNGTRINVIPITLHQIVLGRGSASKPVDVQLPGDPEISRRHIVIMADGTGQFWVTNEGRNPATVNNAELQTGLSVKIAAGTPIIVCSYVLRVQP